MRQLLACVALLLTTLGIGGVAKAVDEPAFTEQQIDFFESKVRPVLVENCFGCHSHNQLSKEVKSARGGIFLDSRSAIVDEGLAEPGKPDESHFIEAIRYGNPEYAMPPKGKLSPAVIKNLEKWVSLGLPWPEEKAVEKASFDLGARRDSHWAWQPPSRAALPVVAGRAGDANPIDLFLEHRLAKEGFTPAPQADRTTLIRRVTFDLTGLPPARAEIDAFVHDNDPRAYEKLVDRLLQSQAYGEKWARHWLDLMRYAESFGHEFDYSIPHPWVYRNYVIKAMNDDIAYDRFVMEHVAGDLLPPRRDPDTQVNEAIKATGWWYFHEQTHSPTDVRQHEADRIDNQIDVLSKSFLGITVACARCHDHKFDAIGNEDYYALAGYLQSSRMQEAYLGGTRMEEHIAKIREIVQQGQSALDKIKARRLSPTKIEHAATVLYEDFNGGSFGSWTTSGWAWGDRPTAPGQWDPNSGKAVMFEPGVAHSGQLGNELVGTLRSPDFDCDQGNVWLRVKGKGLARVVIDTYIMARYNGLLFQRQQVKIDTKGKWQWIQLRSQFDFHTKGNHRAFVEIIDDDRNASLMVDEMRLGNQGPPAPNDAAAEAETADASVDQQFEKITKRFRESAAKTPQPSRALAISEGTAEDSYVHIRGSWKNKGETIPRRFLEALGAKRSESQAGSGRRELAEAIVSPSNQLTARVQVNRLWHHLFGRGIVSTVDNFGVLGTQPSHPDLLDYLAIAFVEQDNWSNKKMIKRIVMSSAYRRSSAKGDLEAEKKDPDNVLLRRQNVRRLTAESIRDSILAVSGTLKKQMHGRSENVHLTASMQGRGRPGNGKLDGGGYRSIYISVRRNFLSPMMLAFDRPIPFSTVGRRNVTNVPGQSLTLMNSPFVHGEATKWAQQLKSSGAASAEKQVREMWLAALGRAPSEMETTSVVEYLKRQNGKPDMTNDDLLKNGSWKELCHAIFNLKEFIYVR